jgi:hypothetical protein
VTTIERRGTAPMMTAARELASDATMEISPEALEALEALGVRRTASGDPVDELVARVRGRATQAVDSLQIAAMLEADGINDRGARVEYGFADVFELAEDVFRRLGGPVPRLRRMTEPRRGAARAWRDVSHGLLYLLPSALFPAVVAAVSPRALVAALVVAGGLGWFWAGGANWLAYQWLNRHDTRTAGRVLAWSSAAGILVAAGAGIVVGVVTHGGVAAAVIVPGVMAYQMASTLLLFYRRELWVAALLLPGAVAGLLYVGTGRPMLVPALAVVALCVLAALGVGLWQALRPTAGHPKPVGMRNQLRGKEVRFGLVLLYGALSAAFLLHVQAPYLLTHLDVVVAGASLIVAMGVVEWRARRFTERSRWLLVQVRYPRQFVRRVWLLLIANLAVAQLAVAVGGGAVLLVLHRLGRLTPAGVAMAAAQVALAGAYVLAFIVAGHDAYGRLCLALAGSVAAHVVPARLLHAGPALDVTLFLGSTVLLQVLLLGCLAPVIGQVRRYR